MVGIGWLGEITMVMNALCNIHHYKQMKHKLMSIVGIFTLLHLFLAARLTAFWNFHSLFFLLSSQPIKSITRPRQPSPSSTMASCEQSTHQLTQLVLLKSSAVSYCYLQSILKRRFAVQGAVLEWFRSHLWDCAQTLSDSIVSSTTYGINCTVSQGSALGPVPLIVYTRQQSK